MTYSIFLIGPLLSVLFIVLVVLSGAVKRAWFWMNDKPYDKKNPVIHIIASNLGFKKSDPYMA